MDLKAITFKRLVLITQTTVFTTIIFRVTIYLADKMISALIFFLLSRFDMQLSFNLSYISLYISYENLVTY